MRVRLDVRREAAGDYSATLADVGADGGAELLRHWSHEDALHVGRQRAQLRLRARERPRVPVL